MKQNFSNTQDRLDALLGLEGAFDFKKRPFLIGEKKAILTYVIGYVDSMAIERILSFLLRIETKNTDSMEEILLKSLPFGSSEITEEIPFAADEVLRGCASLVMEGSNRILLMDLRSFALRGVEEPEKDRTLRGPHIGTNESLISNLVQIRRYLRTGNLQTKKYVLGEMSKTDVVMISLNQKADPSFLKKLDQKLSSASLPSLSMTQETLANFLFPAKGLSVLNPFPRVRYTERPDVVAASLMEGKIAILCDNSPSVMLLPECIFDHFEETDDYYFPPITASYLRIIRVLIFLASIFMIPIWLLVVKNADHLPESLHFVLTKDSFAVPLFLQFLIIEFAIDGLKMASLNTPTTLSGSFSVIGGLLLGEFAVKSGWFVPQAILYSAFTGIATFIPTNIELAYCFKFIRITLILLVEFFGIWGLLSGLLIWLLVLITTKNAAGKGYLYPFFPFDKKGILKIFVRTRKGREQNG